MIHYKDNFKLDK